MTAVIMADFLISLANQPLPFLTIGRRGESGHNRHCRVFSCTKSCVPIRLQYTLPCPRAVSFWLSKMAASCAKSLDTKKEAAISAARRLGYWNFKHEQMKVVLGFLSGRDVFVFLPTGCEKSLCYAVLCLPWTLDIIRNGEPSIFFVVISPLLSLMQDQVT